jgi:hypothetical protein
MELCSIEDAFPIITEGSRRQPPPGCTDSKSSKEERRAARKLAKKCKTRSYDYLNIQDDVAQATAASDQPDPDRPAIKRLGEVSAFVAYADAFPDVSGFSEGFKVPPTTKMPKLNSGLPAYFGADEEGFTDMFPTTQLDLPGHDKNPQTIEGGFDQSGVAKAGSSSGGLPDPQLNDAWKPLTEAKATTAFHPAIYNASNVKASGESPLTISNKQKSVLPPEYPEQYLQAKGGEKIEKRVIESKQASQDTTRDALLLKIKDLTERLQDLEQKHVRNSQAEILLFVGTGVFLLISLEMIMRAGGGRRMA